MFVRPLFLSFALAAVTACGTGQTSSETQEVEDVQSMTLKPDGRYEVFCKDGSREIVTAEDAARGRLCPFNPSDTASRITSIADQTYSNNRTEATELVTFGASGWSGLVSFVSECNPCYNEGRVTIQDGVGGKWVLAANGQTTFSRLITPVKIFSTVPGSNAINFKIKNTTLEINQLAPPAGTFEKGRIDTNTRSPVFFNDIRGAKLSLYASAKFFRNFTAGNVCGRVEIVGADRRVALDAVNDHATVVEMIAPFSIVASATCQSSRIQTPENAESDYLFSIPSIAIDAGEGQPPFASTLSYGDVKPILDANCVRCHNATRSSGRLALDAYPFTSTRLPDQKAIVVRVVERLKSAQAPMPPATESQRPTAADVAKLEAWRDQVSFTP